MSPRQTSPRQTLNDRTGLFPLRTHTHVKVTHPSHSRYLQTGTVVRIAGRRVWVAFRDGSVASAGHRSVEVLPGERPKKKTA